MQLNLIILVCFFVIWNLFLISFMSVSFRLVYIPSSKKSVSRFFNLNWTVDVNLSDTLHRVESKLIRYLNNNEKAIYFVSSILKSILTIWKLIGKTRITHSSLIKQRLFFVNQHLKGSLAITSTAPFKLKPKFFIQ